MWPTNFYFHCAIVAAPRSANRVIPLPRCCILCGLLYLPVEAPAVPVDHPQQHVRELPPSQRVGQAVLAEALRQMQIPVTRPPVPPAVLVADDQALRPRAAERAPDAVAFPEVGDPEGRQFLAATFLVVRLHRLSFPRDPRRPEPFDDRRIQCFVDRHVFLPLDSISGYSIPLAGTPVLLLAFALLALRLRDEV